MPCGENLARCLECGKSWIVGDCIPSTCPQCLCKKEGHQQIGGLPVCVRCGERLPWEKPTTTAEILALPMEPNDAGALTVREYLKALVAAVWRKGEGFSGKRPFGNSGWECDLLRALARGGAIRATFRKEDGYDWEECDIPAAQERRGRGLIAEAIAAL